MGTADNRLFLVAVHVTSGSWSEWPRGILGAIVPVFVPAQELRSAEARGWAKLASLGLDLLGFEGDGTEIALATYADFVHTRWPGFESSFPTERAVRAAVENGTVILGPLLGYEGPLH